MAFHPRNLTILAALAVAGCGGMPSLSLPDVKARNDFKGKPVSVLITRMGSPDYQQTISGQKFYVWRVGTAIQDCLISAGISGDIVDSYNATGDAAICGPYLPAPEPVPARQ